MGIRVVFECKSEGLRGMGLFLMLGIVGTTFVDSAIFPYFCNLSRRDFSKASSLGANCLGLLFLGTDCVPWRAAGKITGLFLYIS